MATRRSEQTLTNRTSCLRLGFLKKSHAAERTRKLPLTVHPATRICGGDGVARPASLSGVF